MDESGVKTLCNCVALGAVYFPLRRGVSWMEAGSHVLEVLKRLVKVSGEVKWRDVKRRNPAAAKLLFEIVDAKRIVIHYRTPDDVVRAVAELARGARLAVVDNQLFPKGAQLGVRYVEKDSRRVPGLQLADVVAGWARDFHCHG